MGSKNIIREGFSPKGLVEIFVAKGKPKHIPIGKVENLYNLPVYRDHRIDFSDCELLETHRVHNIILNQGKNAVISSLTDPNSRFIARMAIGDRGTIPSDSTVPKTPVGSMTSLYYEVFRSDVEFLVKNVSDAVHEVRFVKTFVAADIPITAFSNQSKPVVNEVSLITADPTIQVFPRPDISGPYTYPLAPPYPQNAVPPYNYPPQDELNFSIRTFKSIPFEKDNDITVTIRYTIYIE